MTTSCDDLRPPLSVGIKKNNSVMSELCREKVMNGQRINIIEAQWLIEHASDQLISELASSVKLRFHPSDEATYLIMAIVNYTNICVARCDYCSFFRLPHEEGGYHLSLSEVCKKIDQLASLGGSLVGFNGGFNPNLTLDEFANFFAQIKVRYPHITFYDMTVAEFMFYCKRARWSYADGAKLLKDTGVQWVTGGGAEILADSFRERHSPGKYKCADYWLAQKAILEAGIGSTATMVIGFDETMAERFQHLEMLRAFQDQNDKKLASFLCWTYKPFDNRLGGDEIANRDYLRWLGVSRIFLDNMRHIRTSVLTQNENALDGLLYGADDFDMPTEDEVTEKAGATVSLDFEHILKHAHSLGFKTNHRKPWPVNKQHSGTPCPTHSHVPSNQSPMEAHSRC